MGLFENFGNGFSFGSWSGSDIWNGITDVFSGLFTGKGSIGESLTNPADWWDRFKNGETNSTNKEIAEENLEHERERNEIEDARYEDETTYNRDFAEDERAYQRAFAEDERAYQRAFAEDERAYNRALQQTLFDREDTALERQAQSLSNMGINPLSQQLNGLGAGQALSASSPGTSVPGSSSNADMSSRGGSALHNDFKMQDQGMLPILSSMLSMVNTLNGVKTGEYNRDSLALENDRKFLENLDYANQLGIRYLGPSNKSYRDVITLFDDPNAKNLFKNPQYKASLYSKWRKNRMDSMPAWQYTLDSFGNDDVYKQAENALTKGAALFDRVYENFPNKDNYSKNPFRTLFNLFF